MYTNADCTIFNRRLDSATRRDVWACAQISGVFWDGKHKQEHADKGATDDSDVAVYIPTDATCAHIYKPPKAYASDPSGAYTLSPGDIIVKGLVDQEITASYTIANLLRDQEDAYTITSVEDNRYGSPDMQHFCVKG